MAKKFRILSIDGGGIRGIVPGVILAALERKIQVKTKNLNARLSDYFDLIAGTSTGALLACAYTCPNLKGKNKFSAKEALDFYLKNGGDIFTPPIKKRIFSLWGFIDEKHDETVIESILQREFRTVKLSELLKPTLVVAYNIDNRKSDTKYKIQVFRQHKAKKNKKDDFYVKDMLRGTTAAPAYFEPNQTKSLTNTNYPLIDGGVIANNPSMCAYIEAKKLRKNLKNKDIVLVSLGTGNVVENYPYEKARNWGKVGWAFSILDIALDGGPIITNYFLEQIFEHDGGKYYRFNPRLRFAKHNLDDGTKENIHNLYRDGVDAAAQYDKELDKIIKDII